MPYHVIFEGSELSGKSWIMSQINNELEPKYASRTDDSLVVEIGSFPNQAAVEKIKDWLKI